MLERSRDSTTSAVGGRTRPRADRVHLVEAAEALLEVEEAVRFATLFEADLLPLREERDLRDVRRLNGERA